MCQSDLTMHPRRTFCLFALLVTLAGFRHCDATSIVILVSRQAIVVGADGKMTGTDVRADATANKLETIDGRIVLAEHGVESERDGSGNLVYSFPTFAEDVRSSQARPDSSVSEIAEIVRSKLTEKFKGLDSSLVSHQVRQDQIPWRGSLVTIYVAGYENGQPRVYSIRLDVDWQNSSHAVSGPDSLFQADKNELQPIYGGEVAGIYDVLTNRSGLIHKRMEHCFPNEMYSLDRGRLDLPRLKLKRLAFRLLELEVWVAHDDVGFPLTTVTIDPKGINDTAHYLKPPAHDFDCLGVPPTITQQ